ncbi:MAG: inorganic pyrophosphatase [Chloroflexi bacterium 44-23]|nr:MAG: inorganic pyrophosphatase [Chloroflexi bacterium 44-23]
MKFPSPFFRWRPHPWHGLEAGPNPPKLVHAYIEISPFDLVKYEVDKETGYLRVDRPQRSSSIPPTLYGFIPRTYCGSRVGKLSPKSTRGDGDPLDICVISERPITKSEIILNARVVGGIQMIDDGEADDKIVAILYNDSFWQDINDLPDLPKALIERLQHYFSTYKLIPGKEDLTYIADIYNAEHAFKVVEAALLDYEETYGE